MRLKIVQSLFVSYKDLFFISDGAPVPADAVEHEVGKKLEKEYTCVSSV